MTAILAWFLSNPTILAIGAAIVAAGSAWIHGRLSGAKAQANADKAKEADAYEQSLQDIAAAGDARSSVDVSRVPDRDPYRRD
jgi:hypothetical protein